VDSGKLVHIDTNPYASGPGAGFNPVWSPDSEWIAYTRQLDNVLYAVFIYSLDTHATHQITDGLSDTVSAAFDKSGKYLYFLASTDDGPALVSSMGAYKVPVTRSAYAVVLRKDLRSPLWPLSDEEQIKNATGDKTPTAEMDVCKADEEGGAAGKTADAEASGNKPGKAEEGKKPGATAESKPSDKGTPPAKTQIDFEGISQRIVALPIPARNYDQLLTGKNHSVFLMEGRVVDDSGQAGHILHKFDLCTRKTDKVLDNINGFVISANAEKAMYEQLPPWDPMAPSGGGPQHGAWTIKAVDALGKPSEPGKPDGTLHLEAMSVFTDPRAEWQQMFRDAIRIERDYFYDPNMHGADLKALAAPYQPFVENVMSRPDLNYMLADMLG